MELRHLRAFRMVARTLNFTRAAAELNYAQSSVTEQVQALEAELGVELFARVGRRLSLTPAGERLVSYADDVLKLVEEARNVVEDSADEPSGSLVIGALETLCATVVPDVLSRYRQRYPQVKVAVRQENRGALYASVLAETADVCFTFGAAPARAELCSEALAEERLVVIVPEGHRLSGRGRVRLADLQDEQFMVTGPGCGFREMYDRSLGRLGASGPQVVAEVGSLAALSRCVAAGMGCALLPVMAVEARRGAFDVLRLDDESFSTELTMTWSRRWSEKPSVASFLAVARSAMSGARPS